MKKNIYHHCHAVGYNPDRPRAPWTLDGIHYFNNGNLAECEASDFYGYGFRYDTDGVPFDKGSDIEPLRYSVKSHNCSLGCVYTTHNTPEGKAEIIAEYFRRTRSVGWVYVVRYEEHSDIYEMDAQEFRYLLENFGSMSRESGKTVYKIKIKTSQKMVRWFEGLA